MKIVNARYNLSLGLNENSVNVLVVEHPQVFADIVYSLFHQSCGGEGEFILSENNKELKFDKYMDLIIDPFSLELNNRKILNKLYAQLNSLGNECSEKKDKINSEIVQILDDIVSISRYNNIDFQLDIGWIDIFKLYGVKFGKNYTSLLEKLIEYMKILTHICDISIICFVNCKSYLSSMEIQSLYQMAFYNKIHLILIESSEKEPNVNEKVFIIDCDKCLIEK